MTIINGDIAKNYFYAEVLHQIHIAEDKIRYFANKHQLTFEEFENKIKSSEEENFSLWDDYMEWKAFQKNYAMLLTQKSDIENGNYKVA